MATMAEYLENPEWEKFYWYSMGPPNGGHYKRWIQGSVGMMEPLPLWSNEYGHVYMKHGQNNILPYRGNVKQFAPSVTTNLRNQVNQCTRDTINPAGCQDAAIRKVFTVDSNPYDRHPLSPDITPHPFDVSYETGFSPLEVLIPPNMPYQD